MECPHSDCTNKDIRCHVCVPKGRLYRTKQVSVKKQKKLDSTGKVKRHQKEGMSFQQSVQDKYNKSMKAVQQPNSGAFWTMPGDIITEESLMECKERGTLNSKGKKQISLTKLMFEKIKEEAGQSRAALLPFRFKGDDKIYLAAEFDMWLDLVQQNKLLKEQIKELESDNNGNIN